MASTENTYTKRNLDLREIAEEMKNSKPNPNAYKIKYSGQLPNGISEAFYTQFSDMLNVRFNGPIDLKKLATIATERGYVLDLDSVEPQKVEVCNHRGEMMESEMQKEINPVYRILKNEKGYNWILSVWGIEPDTAVIWSNMKIRFRNTKAPLPNPEAVKVLEEYRRQVYDLNPK